jgi:hypothetical protein
MRISTQHGGCDLAVRVVYQLTDQCARLYILKALLGAISKGEYTIL